MNAQNAQQMLSDLDDRIQEVSKIRNPVKKASMAEAIVFQSVELTRAIVSNLEALNQRTGIELVENEKGVMTWQIKNQ